MVVIGEAAFDVSRDVTVRSRQLERVSTEAVVSLNLFCVCHRPAVLDPREDKRCSHLGIRQFCLFHQRRQLQH